MNKTSLKGARFSFVALGVSMVALIVSYISVTVLTVLRERQQTPRLAVDSLVRAFRTHHKQTGRFPADFWELEERVWKHKKSPDFGADGCSLSVANYFYLYHLVDANSATMWVIPIGPYREKASTHFILVNPDSLRRWKGAPLTLKQIKDLPVVPQYRQMADLGMTEQAPVDLGKGR